MTYGERKVCISGVQGQFPYWMVRGRSHLKLAPIHDFTGLFLLQIDGLLPSGLINTVYSVYSGPTAQYNDGRKVRPIWARGIPPPPPGILIRIPKMH